jgi:hypothetical protein
MNKIRDATSNRRGNFPGAERKPPLKALADPANLQSEVPAIKKAAEIKTEEDMAPQKIKAVKYLATVGCGCYPGVKEALLESLGDCTEEVRYQTVLAIEDASTMHCETCNSDCCCNEELTKKLAELAYEKNDKGCWLEPSERVREAAKNAMRSCCPGQGPPEDVTPVRRDEVIPSEETIPTPPSPESVPDSDRSAKRLPPTTPSVISAKRVHEARVSDAVETEEIVTVDFGNQPQGGSAVVSSSRRTTSPGATAKAPAAPKTTPASTKRSKPPVDAPSGPSSRRAASQRGLAAPTASAVSVQSQPSSRAVESRVMQKSDNAVSNASFAGDDPMHGRMSLAPKVGPPAPPAASGPQQRHAVRGAVARISKDAGTVEVRLDNTGDRLYVGDRLQIRREYLLDGGGVVGYLEVISTGPRGVTTRPLGDLRLDQISRGDEARFEVTRSPSLARLPAVSPKTMAAR